MTLTISTTLAPHGPATALILSDEQSAELGGGARAAVRVTIAGRTARLRLARMGGQNMIGLSKAARSELGVEIGDAVIAEIELDTEERTVSVPGELSAALDAHAGARAAFDTFSYTRRKELALGVASAKRAETRERRIAAVLAATLAELDATPAAEA